MTLVFFLQSKYQKKWGNQKSSQNSNSNSRLFFNILLIVEFQFFIPVSL